MFMLSTLLSRSELPGDGRVESWVSVSVAVESSSPLESSFSEENRII